MVEENQEPEDNQEPEVTHDITDVLGANEDLWYKRRMKMPELVGKTLKLTRGEFRAKDDGGYYILHFENTEGMKATATSSSPKIKAQMSAIMNRDAFPLMMRIEPDGKGYQMVTAKE